MWQDKIQLFYFARCRCLCFSLIFALDLLPLKTNTIRSLTYTSSLEIHFRVFFFSFLFIPQILWVFGKIKYENLHFFFLSHFRSFTFSYKLKQIECAMHTHTWLFCWIINRMLKFDLCAKCAHQIDSNIQWQT